MCYDENVLSAYSDGELDIRLLDEITAHLEICGRCRSIAAKYRKLGELFSVEDNVRKEAFLSSEHTVWNRVQTRIRRERKGTAIPLWRRRLTVPVPVAAGVLLTVCVLCAVLIFSPETFLPDDTSALIAQQIEMDKQSVDLSTDKTLPELEKLVQFLSEQGAAIEVRIELPGSSHFEVIGEPQLIKASDYRKDAAQ